MSAVKAGRSGYTIDGDLYRRATTITGAAPKPWLGYWAAKMVAEYVAEDPVFVSQLVRKGKYDAIKHLKGIPWSKRDQAADRGTLVHSIVECLIEDRDLPEFSGDEQGYADAFLAFNETFAPHYLRTETTVFDPVLRVAGTFDAIATISGESWLLDWKTSGAIYAEYSLQLAFYKHAPYIAQADEQGRFIAGFPKPHLDRAGAVHLRADGTFDLVEMDCGDESFAVFKALAEVAAWTDSVKGWKPEPVVPEVAA